MHTYARAYIRTYLPTYLHTYIHTYVHMLIAVHAYGTNMGHTHVFWCYTHTSVQTHVPIMRLFPLMLGALSVSVSLSLSASAPSAPLMM